MFWVVPFGFSLLFWFPYWFWKENQRKTIRKPIPADSGASPELPSGSLSPLPALGLLLRDFPWVSPCWPPLGSSGWLCPPPSSLCLLLRVIRKKSDSGASPELRSGALCLFSFTRYGERRIPYGLLWTCWDSPFSISPTQPALGLLLRDFPWVSPCRLASSGLLWLHYIYYNVVWAGHLGLV